MPKPQKLDEKQLLRLAQDIEQGVPIPVLAKTYDVSVRYLYKYKKDLEADKKLLAQGIEGGDAPAVIPPPEKRRSLGLCGCVNGYYFRDYVARLKKHNPDDPTAQGYPDPASLRHSFERFEGEEEKWICSARCLRMYKKSDLRMFPTKAEGGTGTLCREFRESMIRKASVFFPELDFEAEKKPDYLIG